MVVALILLYWILVAIMSISIIFFETNSKKIIFWQLIVATTFVFGYIIYLFFYKDKKGIKKYLFMKEKEDNIYRNLTKYEVDKKLTKCDLINFAKRVYNANSYINSELKIINSNENFNNEIMDDIDKANKYIIISTCNFLNSFNREAIMSLLLEKQRTGVPVRVIYSSAKLEDFKYIKELKNAGIRCCKFYKKLNCYSFYKNFKNIVSIDGKTAYLFSYSKLTSNNKKKISLDDLYYKLNGDIVRSIDMEIHLDYCFATRKFHTPLGYSDANINSNIDFQYIGSSISNSFLDLILKAIIETKRSLTIHVDKFIPNESIMEAIKLAVKSNIDVKLMISNKNRIYGYYTSRSYVKELAREGVTSYFYDGHINTNYVIVDDEIVMTGNMSFVNHSLVSNLQDVLIINDKLTAKKFASMFAESVVNSYKLSNPKRILFREKFFRKFM